MKSKIKIGILLVLFLISVNAGCLKEAAPSTPAPTVTAAPPTKAPVTVAPVNVDLVALGGRLYDKWWKEAGVTEPTEDQAIWATQSTNTRSGSTTWRCKECHGWDYKGKDGAYGSGSHYTGFPGIFEAAQTKTTEELTAAMKGATNPDHDFTSAMGDANIDNVVLFLKHGVVNQAQYIDYAAKKPKSADATNGKELFEKSCSLCHGLDGTMINFGSEEEPEYVGTVASHNPWEALHKIRAGQPGSEPPMPSALVNGWSMQDVVDVLAYAQTLPEEAEEKGTAANVADIAMGGRLYDKWYKELGLDTPTEDQPLWAQQTTNTRGAKDNWRCKECHGWDYKGKDGAYGSGSHYTGFPGIFEAVAGKSAEDLAGILEGSENPDHDFSAALGHEGSHKLAAFLSEGLIDNSKYIDYATKKPIGANVDNGKTLFDNTCKACHGIDGTQINFGSEEEPEYVGTVASHNPWEALHKIRAGQPGSEPPMPSALVNGWSIQDVVDVLAYAQTLPEE
ncbi:MAG: c-type cytochrome [Candidatus Hydrothermarchaeales archaeon]